MPTKHADFLPHINGSRALSSCTGTPGWLSRGDLRRCRSTAMPLPRNRGKQPSIGKSGESRERDATEQTASLKGSFDLA
jgi:hypothetical protein